MHTQQLTVLCFLFLSPPHHHLPETSKLQSRKINLLDLLSCNAAMKLFVALHALVLIPGGLGVQLLHASVNQTYVNDGDVIVLTCVSDGSAAVVSWTYDTFVVRSDGETGCRADGELQGVGDRITLLNCLVHNSTHFIIRVRMDVMNSSVGTWTCRDTQNNGRDTIIENFGKYLQNKT